MNNPTSYKVRSIGGSLMVTLPQSVLRMLPLKAGDLVTFTVAGKNGGVIVIEPVRASKGKSK